MAHQYRLFRHVDTSENEYVYRKPSVRLIQISIQDKNTGTQISIKKQKYKNKGKKKKA